jgi:hypothetical protein
LFVGVEQTLDRTEGTEDAAGLHGEEQLGGLSIGNLAERFQVLDGDQIRGGVTVVDGAEHPLDRLAFTFGDGEQLELLGIGNLPDGLGLTLGLEDA